MKINVAILGLIIAPLLLTGCENDKATSESTITSASSSSSSSSDTSSSSTPVADEWTGEARDLLLSFVGENIPFIKGFESSYSIGSVSGSTKPYFNPYIKGANDYTNEYKSKLISLGFTFDGVGEDDGYPKYSYHHNDIILTHAYYSNEGSYWFDVYAFNDKDPEDIPTGYQTSLTSSDFAKSYDAKTFSKNGVSFSSSNVMNQNSNIQFKKDVGKLAISGSSFTKIIVSYVQYPQCLILKSGSSSGNATAKFNNANVYNLNNDSYIELSTPTISGNTSHICTISAIYIY